MPEQSTPESRADWTRYGLIVVLNLAIIAMGVRAQFGAIGPAPAVATAVDWVLLLAIPVFLLVALQRLVRLRDESDATRRHRMCVQLLLLLVSAWVFGLLCFTRQPGPFWLAMVGTAMVSVGGLMIRPPEVRKPERSVFRKEDPT